MKLIYIAITVLFFIGIENGSSQSNEEADKDYSVNIDIQTPNAHSITKIAELPIDYYNGTVTTTIPVFNDFENDIPINLSLIYNSSGLKVEEIPGWVGLDWTLNVGGIITRSIVGFADESDIGILTGDIGLKLREHTDALLDLRTQLEASNLTQSQKDALNAQAFPHIKYLKEGNEGQYDIGHDVFAITLPEGSATFFFNPSYNNERQVVTPANVLYKEDVNWKIEYSIGDIVSGGLSVNDVIVKFVVTTSTNTRYHFEQYQVTKTFNSKKPNQNPYTNAWYLTKVESGSSDAFVEYKYKPLSTERIWQPPVNTSINASVETINNLTDELMTSTTGTFFTSQQEVEHHVVFLNEINYGETQLKFYSTLRSDFDKQEKLDSIEVIKESQKVQSIIFKTSYFPIKSLMKYSWYNDIDYGFTKLRLDGIKIRNNKSDELNEHSFKYIAGSVPHYLSFEKDVFGYYNGIGTNNLSTTIKLPAMGFINYHGQYQQLQGLDMHSDNEMSKIGMLESVTYPTGAKVEFEYESNSYDYTFGVQPDGEMPILSMNPTEFVDRKKEVFTYGFPITGGEKEMISDDFFILKDLPFLPNEQVSVELKIAAKVVGAGAFLDGYLIKLDEDLNETIVRSIHLTYLIDDPHPTDSDGYKNNSIQFDVGEGNYKLKIKTSNIIYGDIETPTLDAYVQVNWLARNGTYLANGEKNSVISNPASGNRVRKIKYINPLGGSGSYSKELKYVEERNGLVYSTGKLERFPMYNFFGFADVNENNGLTYYFVPILYRSLVPLISSGYAGKHSVGYSSVKESTINNNIQYNIVHYFSHESDGVLSVINDDAVFSGTLKNIVDNSIFRGNNYLTEFYNDIDEKVWKKNTIYDVIKRGHQNTGYLDIPKVEWRNLKLTIQEVGGLVDNAVLGLTKVNGYSKNVKTIENHHIAGTEDVTTIEEYEYALDYNLLSSKTVYSSQNTYTKKEFYYTALDSVDFNNTGTNAIDFPSKILNYEYDNGVGKFKGGKKFIWSIVDKKSSLKSHYLFEDSTKLLNISNINYDEFGRPIVITKPNGLIKKISWAKNTKWKPMATTEGIHSESYTQSFSYDGLGSWQKAPNSNTLTLDGENRWVFRFPTTSSTTPTDYRLNLVNDAGLSLTNSDKVVFEFDFMASSYPPTNIGTFYFRAGEGSATSTKGVQFFVQNDTFYMNSLYPGSKVAILSGLQGGRVYAIKIVVDMFTDTADFYIDGYVMKKGLVLRSIPSNPLSEMALWARGNNVAAVNYYIDNFRVYKYGAQVQSAELSKLDGRVTSIKSADGLTTRFGYDGWGRLVDSRTESGPVTKQFYSYGDLQNDPLKAPYVETIVLSDRSPISVFASSGWTGGGDMSRVTLGYYSQEDDEYILKRYANGTTTTYSSVSLGTGEQFWVDVYVGKMLTSGSMAQVYIENNDNGSKYVMLQYKVTSGGEFQIRDNTGASLWSLTISDSTNNMPKQGWYTLEFTYLEDGYLEMKVRQRGGRLLGQRKSTTSYLGAQIKVTSSVAGTSQDTLCLSRPVLAKSVVSTVEYTDGLGRPVQQQTVAGAKRMVSGTYLDGKGNAVASLRPVELTSGSGFESFSTLFGSPNWKPKDALSTSSLTKQRVESTGIVSNDAQFAYSTTDYEASPLNRVERQIEPGAVAYGANAPNVTYSYGVKSGVNAHSKLLGTLSYTMVTDQVGNKTTSYTDGFGREVLKVVDMNNNGLDFNSADLMTLFEYDGLGNLIKSIDPRGLETVYRYNTLGQLVAKKLPDMTDSVRYRYDGMGNLRFVQQPNHRLSATGGGQTYYLSGGSSSAKSIATGGTHGVLYVGLESFGGSVQTYVKQNGKTVLTYTVADQEVDSFSSLVSSDVTVEIDTSPDNLTTLRYDPFKYTYTLYDGFGRVTETGEYWGTTGFDVADVNNVTFPGSSKQPLVKYYYDELNAVSGANNTAGKLAKVEYYLSGDLSRKGTTSYSYTSQGLVEWVKQEVPRGESATISSTVYYTYRDDGQLLKKRVLVGSQNLYQWNYYDGFGRLSSTKSHTSDSEGSAQTDVTYTYDALGQVKTKALGNAIQAVDYSYDVRGWLTSINNPVSMGSDQFAQSMSYLANGNISGVKFTQKKISLDTLGFTYTYDRAGRLTQSKRVANDFYRVDYGYDKNGNIDYIQRYNGSGVSTALDLGYQYGTNKLWNVEDLNADNYLVTHDSRGNMISHEKKHINSISYDNRNLAYRLITDSGVHQYQHDGSGNRVMKTYNGASALYYIRDGEGKVQAVLNKDGVLLFWNIYSGSEMIGKRNP